MNVTRVKLGGKFNCVVCGDEIDWEYDRERGAVMSGPIGTVAVAVTRKNDVVTFEVDVPCINGCGFTNRFTVEHRIR